MERWDEARSESNCDMFWRQFAESDATPNEPEDDEEEEEEEESWDCTYRKDNPIEL